MHVRNERVWRLQDSMCSCCGVTVLQGTCTLLDEERSTHLFSAFFSLKRREERRVSSRVHSAVFFLALFCFQIPPPPPSSFFKGNFQKLLQTGLIKSEIFSHNRKFISIRIAFRLNETCSLTLTVVMFRLTDFCDSKQEAVDFLIKNKQLHRKNSVNKFGS